MTDVSFGRQNILLRHSWWTAAAERPACKCVRFNVHFSRHPTHLDVSELLDENACHRAQVFEVLGLEFPVAVDGVDDERRVEEHPDSINPVATSKLETFDEGFVLCFVMVPSPSDSLRDLIYITVLRVFQHDPDRGLTGGLTSLGGYPAVGFQHVEARLRRGAVR